MSATNRFGRIALFSLLLVCPIAAVAQGFGTFSHRTVTVNRLLPATVNLNGKKIRIEARSEATVKDGNDAKSLLKTKLVTLIQKDPRFLLDEASPQTILRFTITNYYLEEYQTTDSKGKTSHSWRGKIEVAYQAIDVNTDAALDSENLVQTAGLDVAKENSSIMETLHLAKKDNKQAAAEASSNETRDQLVDGIVALMGKRVAPAEEPFEAALPGGKTLEPISALALSHRWGAMEEQAQSLAKFPKPEEDTYRLYLVALAKEAQAYDLAKEANDQNLGKRTDITQQEADAEFRRAQKYIDEAGAIYKEIVAANPKEHDFRPGDARTEQAIPIYATIARYKEEYQKALAAAALAAAATKKQSAASGSAAAVRDNKPSVTSPLNQIIDFCNRGMAMAIINEYIQSPDFMQAAQASNYRFNFAKDSISLNDACKTNAAPIISKMRARLGAAPATRSAPAKK